MLYRRRIGFVALCALVCLSGCVRKSQVRLRPQTPRAMPLPPPPRPRLRRPLPPPPPPFQAEVAMFQRFGRAVVRRGQQLRQRFDWLRRRCTIRPTRRCRLRRCRRSRRCRRRCRLQLRQRHRKAARRCRVFWRSALMFARYYRTHRSLYRGYANFSGRRWYRVPRYLRRWYARIKSKMYRGQGETLSRGLVTNCMGFAIHAQQGAAKRFSGAWGPGLTFHMMGYVNYWSNRAYLALLRDYQVQGQRRRGILHYYQHAAKWSPALRRQRARSLLRDMFERFMQIGRRTGKLRSHWSREYYQKLFCTNIVAGAGSFSRALPGDLFGISYLYRHGKRLSQVRFQHWGVIVKPSEGKVLHNQTPGGLWGRQFRRWGIQYGHYSPQFLARPWRRIGRSARFKRRLVFVNRLNIHYLLYAKAQGVPVFGSRARPNLCRDWIDKYAELYFVNMAKYTPAKLFPSTARYVSLQQP